MTFIAEVCLSFIAGVFTGWLALSLIKLGLAYYHQQMAHSTDNAKLAMKELRDQTEAAIAELSRGQFFEMIEKTTEAAKAGKYSIYHCGHLYPDCIEYLRKTGFKLKYYECNEYTSEQWEVSWK